MAKNAMDAEVGNYESQFFGFRPKKFMDDFHEVLLHYSHKALSNIRDHLCETVPNVNQEELNHGTDSLIALYAKQIGLNMARFEEYMQKKILMIPDDVILPEDKIQKSGQSASAAEREAVQLDHDMKMERNIISASSYTISTLEEEIKELMEVKRQLTDIRNTQLGQLHQINIDWC